MSRQRKVGAGALASGTGTGCSDVAVVAHDRGDTRLLLLVRPHKEVGRLEQFTTWSTKLIYACQAHDIRPCDDANVTEWNEPDPGQAITVDLLRTSY